MLYAIPCYIEACFNGSRRNLFTQVNGAYVPFYWGKCWSEGEIPCQKPTLATSHLCPSWTTCLSGGGISRTMAGTRPSCPCSLRTWKYRMKTLLPQEWTTEVSVCASYFSMACTCSFEITELELTAFYHHYFFRQQMQLRTAVNVLNISH